jgi:ankyrin repeat protein
VTKSLLKSNAPTNDETSKGFTPLHLAAKSGHLDIAKLLIEQGGADMDASGRNQLTPLHLASHYNRENVLIYLLEKGAPPRASADNGYTPLHIAAKKNHLNIAAGLLQYGADPNARSNQGFAPLHLASKEGHTDMVSMLLQHNADPDSSSDNGLTPMHLCSQEDRVHTGHVLLAFGAKVDSRTKVSVFAKFCNAKFPECMLQLHALNPIACSRLTKFLTLQSPGTKIFQYVAKFMTSNVLLARIRKFGSGLECTLEDPGRIRLIRFAHFFFHFRPDTRLCMWPAITPGRIWFDFCYATAPVWTRPA